MQRGLERLDEHGVSVFIITGSLDPPASWKRGISLPDNTTLFISDDDDPITLTDGEQVFAEIAPIATANSDETNWGARGPAVWRSDAGTFRIGLVGAGSAIAWNGDQPEASGGPAASKAAATLVQAAIQQGVNYIALGEGAERSTIELARGIAHDPGSPQGLNPYESGSKGCSLVDVDEDGAVEIQFLPTAAVRWMSFAAEAPNHVDLDQLAERMALVAMESEPHANDDLWLVRWTLQGANAEWTKALGQPHIQAGLWEKLERELASLGGPVRRHQFDALGRPSRDRAAAPDSHQNKVLTGFAEGIEADAAESFEAFQLEVNSGEWAQTAWGRHVRSALQRSSAESIARRARDLGGIWLG
jgi:hypothetical protein